MVVLCRVVWLAVVGRLGGGVVAVWVTVVAVVTAPVVVLLVVEDEVVVREALAFSGGTGVTAPRRVTGTWVPVPEPLEASDPECAGADVDLTALPIPKPAAIAITSNAPSSHHRRSMFLPSLHPVPALMLVALSTGHVY